MADKLDIHSPEYNKEEIAKQMLLLEGHMTKDTFCPECIEKHLLTIEALAQEGYQLGDKDLSDYAQKIRKLRKEILGQEDHTHSDNPGHREYLPHGLTEEEKIDKKLQHTLVRCIKKVEKKQCPKGFKSYEECDVNPVAVCRASVEH